MKGLFNKVGNVDNCNEKSFIKLMSYKYQKTLFSIGKSLIKCFKLRNNVVVLVSKLMFGIEILFTTLSSTLDPWACL